MKALTRYAGRVAILALAISGVPACAIAQAGGIEKVPSEIAGLPVIKMNSGPIVKIEDPKTGISIVGIAYDRNGIAVSGDANPASGHGRTPDIQSLIDHLGGVSDQAEFDAAIRDWQQGHPSPKGDDSTSFSTAQTGTHHALAGAKFASGRGKEAEPTLPVKPGDESLLFALSGAAWIGVGRKGAPIVYMITSVSCHDCIESMNELLPLAQKGQIDLRLIFAPTDDQNLIKLSYIAMSADVKSSIVANTISAFAPVPTEHIRSPDPKIVQALKKNLDLVRHFSLGHPPIIAFETQKGASYLRTMPPADHFLNILAPASSEK